MGTHRSLLAVMVICWGMVAGVCLKGCATGGDDADIVEVMSCQEAVAQLHFESCQEASSGAIEILNACVDTCAGDEECKGGCWDSWDEATESACGPSTDPAFWADCGTCRSSCADLWEGDCLEEWDVPGSECLSDFIECLDACPSDTEMTCEEAVAQLHTEFCQIPARLGTVVLKTCLEWCKGDEQCEDNCWNAYGFAVATCQPGYRLLFESHVCGDCYTACSETFDNVCLPDPDKPRGRCFEELMQCSDACPVP